MKSKVTFLTLLIVYTISTYFNYSFAQNSNEFAREAAACKARCLKECSLKDPLVSCADCIAGCIPDGKAPQVKNTQKKCDCDHAFTSDFWQRFCRASRLCAEPNMPATK
jgi:hypothetical protein